MRRLAALAAVTLFMLGCDAPSKSNPDERNKRQEEVSNVEAEVGRLARAHDCQEAYASEVMGALKGVITVTGKRVEYLTISQWNVIKDTPGIHVRVWCKG